MKSKYSVQERISLIEKIISGKSISEVAKDAKVSRILLYKWLRRYKLQGEEGLKPQKAGRPRKSRTPKKLGSPKPLSSLERLRMVQEVLEDGKSASDVAKQYGVSRVTLYKWIDRLKQAPDKRLASVEDKKREVSYYFRQTPEKYEEVVLKLVAQHPEYGVRRLLQKVPQIGRKPIVGHHGIQNVLTRHSLATYEQRLAYAQGQITPVTRLITQILGFASRFFAIPQVPRARIVRFGAIAALSMFTTVVIFGLGGYFAQTFVSVSLSTKIGLIFATVALGFGSIFFLYSLKYYISLAIVLSFSQQEALSRSSIINSNGRGKGFLSWIFGFRPRRASGPEGEEKRSIGLESNLEHITLSKYPKISVHIPLYNEKNVVERVLSAVTSFDYKGEYEVIIADDSTDETSQIIFDYLRSTKSQISSSKGEGYTLTEVEIRSGVVLKHLHRTSRSGFKGGALREALRVSDPKAEFVTVFDADFVPYPDTLELFLKYFQAVAGTLDFTRTRNSGAKAIESGPDPIGRSAPSRMDSPIAAVQGYQWHVLNKSENWITSGVRSEYAGSYVIERSGAEIYSGIKQISGSVYMIRRDVLEEIGWETSITEDFQLTLKLYEKGYKVVYTPYIQAPAECVSTLKRLIRQRMRWAEGHSNNIKRMFTRLLFGSWENRKPSIVNGKLNNSDYGLRITDYERKWIPSPLSLSEKLEFLYLSPYYLQSFFFLVGTFSWLISETLLPARLPFWTSLWGWSLVLTNMLSLPLMNAVGLFLEESEERDYLGLASFFAMSYILVPFQAYAAVKGFLQKEEGPWFRTPKTGKITDIFTRGKFYRFISGILPGRSPQPAVAQSKGTRQWALGFRGLMPKPYTLNPYLSLATANSRFNSFNIKPRSLGARWVGRVLVTVFLIISTTMLYFSPSIPSYPDEVIANGTDFRWDQTPRLILDLKGARSLKQSILPRTNEVYAKGDEEISTKVYYQGEEKDIPVEVKELESGKLEVALLSNESLRPGKYKVVATVERAGKDVTISQDFTWGVLAINTDKSTYLPGEKVSLSFAVLNDGGHMVCDALLRLKIQATEGKPIYLSTEDGTIKVNPDCSRKGYTQIPDFEAEYEVGEVGLYNLELSALTENGPRAIKDSFEVRDWVAFDIQRQAPTRIYPLSSYPVNIKVQANQDFRGEVIESIPESFGIEESSEFNVEHLLEDIKQLVWNVDWKKGETYKLSYVFNAPIISPEFYLLGPLTLRSLGEGGPSTLFEEVRRWQVASDSTQPSVQSVTGQTAGAVNQVVVNSVPGGTNQLYIAVGHFNITTVAVGNNVISSITAGGLTWALVTGTRGCSDRVTGFRTEWWWAFGSPSTFNATVDLAGPTEIVGAHVAFVRIDGAANQEPINGEYANTAGDAAACDSTGTDNTSPTIGLTISNSTSLALNSAHPRNSATGVTTPDTNYTQDYEVLNISGGNASTIWAGHRTTSPAIGTETITHSLSATRPWVMVAAEIKVPEYSLIWLGLAPFLPGVIGRMRRRRK